MKQIVESLSVSNIDEDNNNFCDVVDQRWYAFHMNQGTNDHHGNVREGTQFDDIKSLSKFQFSSSLGGICAKTPVQIEEINERRKTTNIYLK